MDNIEDNPIVVTHGLTKLYGTFAAVKDVSFSVHKGEIIGILGENGAGKTTLIKMLCGVLKPNDGSATILGYDIIKQCDKVRECIGYMSQTVSLLENMTVKENIYFYGSIYKMDKREIDLKYSEFKNRFGFEKFENKLTGELTNGWRRILAFSIAVLKSPSLLFLDEPSGGLDALARIELWEHIYNMAHVGTTVILSSHYMSEVMLCDRQLVMSAGIVSTIKQTSF